MLFAGCLWSGFTGTAFPPAPHHLIYGMVRDERGTPLTGSATIVLTTSAGVELRTEIQPGLRPGINYVFKAPMDSGITDDIYSATALSPSADFTLKVRIDGVDYLPIQMQGNGGGRLGKPAKLTRIDLTLGEDVDGDGLPDSWEQSLIKSVAGLYTIEDVDPNADSDGDGLSNIAEYTAGTYAFDAENLIDLKVAGLNQGRPQIDFMVIRGRSYSVLYSTNLTDWTLVGFHLSGENTGGPPQKNYTATDVRLLRVETVNVTNTGGYFRLQVQ